MRIGFCGPFCDTNFGDYAMLVNDILEIGESDIVVFLPKESIGKINRILQRYLPDYSIDICSVETTSKDMSVRTGKKYSIVYRTYAETPIEVLQEVENKHQVQKFIDSVDTLVVCGGGFLNQTWHAEHRKARLYAILSVMLLAEFAGKKIVFLGNTIGPFNSSRDFYQIIFSKLKSATIALRDDFLSPCELASLGVKNKTFAIIDDLYFINERIETYDPSVLQRIAKLSDNKATKYIIIEQYSSLEEIELNIDTYRVFAHEMKRKYNLRVIFCALDNAYGGFNQGDYLAKEIDAINLWNSAEDSYLPIGEIVTLIKGAEFVICQRYHLSVLSLANNIPFIQVLKDVCGDKRYYYTKTMGTIAKILKGIPFEESVFFELSFPSAMVRIIRDFTTIVTKQMQLFGNKKIDNEIFELANRRAYLKSEINTQS